MFVDDVQSTISAATTSAPSPSEAQLVLLCLDYLRDLRRAFSTNQDDLLVAEGIDGDYITLAIWALSRSFVKPKELQVSSRYMCVSDDVVKEQASKSTKLGNDPWFEVENADPTVIKNCMNRPQDEATFPISSTMYIPTLHQMEKELLYRSCPDKIIQQGHADDDYYTYPINWYEHDENHFSNSHRFYVQRGLSSGSPLTLGELAVAGLAGLNGRSRHDANLEIQSSDLFQQFVKAVESKGFFDVIDKNNDGEMTPEEIYDERFAKVVAKFRSKLALKEEQEQKAQQQQQQQTKENKYHQPSPKIQRHEKHVPEEDITTSYGIAGLSSPSSLKQRRFQQLSKIRNSPRNHHVLGNLPPAEGRQPLSSDRQPHQRVLASMNHHSERNRGNEGFSAMRTPSPQIMHHAEKSINAKKENMRSIMKSPSIDKDAHQHSSSKQWNTKMDNEPIVMKTAFSFTTHDPSYAPPKDRSSIRSRTPTKVSGSSSQRKSLRSSSPVPRNPDQNRNQDDLSIKSRNSRSRSATPSQRKVPSQSETMRSTGSSLEQTLQRIDREHSKNGTKVDDQSRNVSTVHTGQTRSKKQGTDLSCQSFERSDGNSTMYAKSIIYSDSDAGDDGHSHVDESTTVNGDDQSVVELEKAERLKSNGNHHMQAREYLKAVEAYSAALLICPSGRTSHVYFSNRAAAYLSLKMFEEAITDCRRSLALNPTYGKAHSRLGLAYFLLGQYEEAVEAYEGAVAIEPNNATAISYLEKSKKKIEQESKKKTSKSRRSRKSSSTQDGSLSGDSVSMNQTEYSKSTTRERSDSRSRSLRKFDDEVSTVGSLSLKSHLSPEERAAIQRADKFKSEGNKYMAARQFERAVRSYGNALKVSPDGVHSHIYYSNRAAALCYLECYEDAERDALASLKLRPDYAKAHARLGLSRYSQSNYEGAVSAYKKALVYGPDSSASQSYLAKAKAKLAKQRQRQSISN